jgi:hypothetical protein
VLRSPVEPGQYTALRFTQRLIDAGVAPSTGSTGDSYDNALAKNLWSTIKVELVYWPGTTFATRTEAEHALIRYIDGWYNPRRIQAGLGGLAPVHPCCRARAADPRSPAPNGATRSSIAARRALAVAAQRSRPGTPPACGGSGRRRSRHPGGCRSSEPRSNAVPPGRAAVGRTPSSPTGMPACVEAAGVRDAVGAIQISVIRKSFR